MYRLMRKIRETEEFSMVKLYENNKIFSSKTHGAEILDTVSPKSCNLLSWSHYRTQSKAMVIATPEDDRGQNFEEKTEDEMSSKKTMVIDNSKTMVISAQKTGVIGSPKTGVIGSPKTGVIDSPKTIGLIWPVKTGVIWTGQNPEAGTKTGPVKTGTIWPG